MSEATVAAACSSIEGKTWEYVSNVIVIDAWPSLSDTTFGWIPATRDATA